MNTSFKNTIFSLLHPTINIPTHLSSNFKCINESSVEILRQSLIQHYFSRQIENIKEYLNSPEGIDDLQNHLFGRLNRFRHTYIPFIDYCCSIAGKKILEIGCGTGASTLALAEQNPLKITSIDIDNHSITSAKNRLSLYGLDENVEFHCLNASNLLDNFPKNEFDIIIYFATYEHLNIRERIQSLRDAYHILKPGGLIFILEAPNRLWCFDHHTAFLPFYLWLPPELAILYSQKIQRDIIRKKISYNNFPMENEIKDFYRIGTGVSFHEIEIALPDVDLLEQIKSLNEIFIISLVGKLLQPLTFNHQYKKLLKKINPQKIHPGFYEPFIDIAIKKS